MGDRRLTHLVRLRAGSLIASSQIFLTKETGSTGDTVLKNTTVTCQSRIIVSPEVMFTYRIAHRSEQA